MPDFVLEKCLEFCKNQIELQVQEIKGQGEVRMMELMTEWKEKFLQVELKNVLKSHFEINDHEGAQLQQSKGTQLKRSNLDGMHLESVCTVKKRNPMKIVEDQTRSADEIASIA